MEVFFCVLRRMFEVLWEVRWSPKGSGRVTALAPASSIHMYESA